MIDISLELKKSLLSKLIFSYTINQIDFVVIHAAISKCRIMKNNDVYDSTERIQTLGNNEK